jgi:hypothetical protein
MISMRRTLFPGMLAAVWLGVSGLCAWGQAQADPPLLNTPASYRLFNPSTMGPRTSGCGRCEPLPCSNPGCFLNNPRGTGSDDPWRPPHCWPQTRYPVVPAYTRPSYGYYETSWRILPLCNPTPSAAGPIYPAGYQSTSPTAPPAGAVPQAQPGNAPGTLPRPPVVPPAGQPAQPGPPAATPPTANPPVPQPAPAEAIPGGPPTAVPVVPLQPQKTTAPTNELQPSPPKATPPANPARKGLNQGALPSNTPQRDAMLDLQGEEAPEIRVQPF